MPGGSGKGSSSAMVCLMRMVCRGLCWASVNAAPMAFKVSSPSDTCAHWQSAWAPAYSWTRPAQQLHGWTTMLSCCRACPCAAVAAEGPLESWLRLVCQMHSISAGAKQARPASTWTCLAKEGVLAVQGVQVGPQGKVELGGVCVLARPRHAHHARLGVAQARVQLILKEARLVPIQQPAQQSCQTAATCTPLQLPVACRQCARQQLQITRINLAAGCTVSGQRT